MLIVAAVAASVFSYQNLPDLIPTHWDLDGDVNGWSSTVLVFMLGMHLVVLRAAMGHPVSMQKVMPVGIGLLLVAIGNLLPSARSNFFIGIRTPWTLSSERAWERTHRAGGYVFVLMGLIIAASALVSSPAGFRWMLLVAVSASVGLIVYSYLVWRDDPHRKAATFITTR